MSPTSGHSPSFPSPLKLGDREWRIERGHDEGQGAWHRGKSNIESAVNQYLRVAEDIPIGRADRFGHGKTRPRGD